MLHEILPPEKCANCKGCCYFDKEDAWEAPAPLQRPTEETNWHMNCVHLGEDGCVLGSDKPIECSMYPFRVMRFGLRNVIALCTYCTAVCELPLTHILRFVERKANQFVALAEDNPSIIKEYTDNYIILKVLS